MKTKKVIETRVEELSSHKFLYVRRSEDDGFFVDTSDSETVKEAAKILKISEKAVEALAESLDYLVEDLVELLKTDLEDIWDEVSE